MEFWMFLLLLFIIIGFIFRARLRRHLRNVIITVIAVIGSFFFARIVDDVMGQPWGWIGFAFGFIWIVPMLREILGNMYPPSPGDRRRREQ